MQKKTAARLGRRSRINIFNYTPRWYQDEAHQAHYDFFASNVHGNPLICMPTGTGKSVVIARFILDVITRWPGQRLMMITHSSELIKQNLQKLLGMWADAPVGVFAAKLKTKQSSMPITFGSVKSVLNAVDDFKAVDLVLIDEAQLVGEKEDTEYRKLLAALKKKNKHVRVIGYTATPYRMGLGMLTDGGIFTHIAYDITGIDAFNRLIDEGYLSPLVPFPTETVLDLSGVGRIGGEYNQKQAAAAIDVTTITRSAIEESLDKARQRKHWLVFASSIEHAENIANMLCMYGQNAAAVHSKLDPNEVDRRIAAFRAGKLRMLVNADMLTVGFDFPNIDCIVMLRATMSPGLWVQMLGRGTRPVYAPGFDIENEMQRWAAIYAGGKENCLVLDFANNISNLGPINDPVLPKARKGDGTGDAPIKKCEDGKVIPLNEGGHPCGMWNHASARTCQFCRAQFIFKPNIMEQAANQPLIVREKPVIQEFKVDHVAYAVWRKLNAPDSIQVQYYCGAQRFSEWISFENPKVRGLAEHWWRVRFRLKRGAACPETTKQAMEFIEKAREPVSIKVHINRQHPKIVDFVFQEMLDEFPIPESVRAAVGNGN